jgi:hypothetical protein
MTFYDINYGTRILIYDRYIAFAVSFQTDTFNGSLILQAGPYSSYNADYSNKKSIAYQYFSRTFLYQVCLMTDGLFIMIYSYINFDLDLGWNSRSLQ